MKKALRIFALFFAAIIGFIIFMEWATKDDAKAKQLCLEAGYPNFTRSPKGEWYCINATTAIPLNNLPSQNTSERNK